MEAQFELATAALLGQMSNVVVLTNSWEMPWRRAILLLKYMMEDDEFSGEVPWRHGIAHEGGGIDDQDGVFQRYRPKNTAASLRTSGRKYCPARTHIGLGPRGWNNARPHRHRISFR